MQAQMNSTAFSLVSGRANTIQGKRIVSPFGSGGSAINELEGMGWLFTVGSWRIKDSADLWLTLKLNPDSLREKDKAVAPASKGYTSVDRPVIFNLCLPPLRPGR